MTLLDPEQVWRRHGDQGNAVGNLLLHLEGNARQWIVSAIDGDDDVRVRDREFATRESGTDALELVDRLEHTAVQAAGIVDALTPEQLVSTRVFQGRYERSVAEAVLHVLEHFSGHAYQIYAWTKQMKGVDLKFWDL